MKEPQQTLDTKVEAFWRKLVGQRYDRLHSLEARREVVRRIAESLDAEELTSTQRKDVAYPMTDWISDAAELLAIYMQPDQFELEEIEEAVRGFLIHAPYHVFGACRSYGEPIEDYLKEGFYTEGAGDMELGTGD